MPFPIRIPVLVINYLRLRKHVSSTTAQIYLDHYIKEASYMHIVSPNLKYTVKEVFAQENEILYPGDAMALWNSDLVEYAKMTMFVSRVRVKAGDVLLSGSTMLEAFVMEPSRDCKHFERNLEPVPQYSWPIDPSWHYLNKIFLANKCSFSRPFQGRDVYVALREAHMATGKISVFASFFENPKYYSTTASKSIISTLLSMDEIPPGTWNCMGFDKTSDRCLYEMTANESCIITRILGARDLYGESIDKSDTIFTVNCVFHSGFKASKSLRSYEGLFQFYNSVLMIGLKFHPLINLKTSNYDRIIFETFVCEKKVDLGEGEVLVVLDGTWVAEGLTVLSVQENLETYNAPCSGLIIAGNRDYTIHSMVQDVQRSYPVQTIRPFRADYIGHQQLF